jgi:hypothetical protein
MIFHLLAPGNAKVIRPEGNMSKPYARQATVLLLVVNSNKAIFYQ